MKLHIKPSRSASRIALVVKLLNFGEPLGDFMARVPGGEKWKATHRRSPMCRELPLVNGKFVP